jgi:hypothetical protein
MILSVHIPKTAGRAFGQMLAAEWGARVLGDYGDWVGVNTAEAVTRRADRTLKARGNRADLLRDYDIIHGHFIADKYIGLFPRTNFVAFFRDPYQQTISHYEFMFRNPKIDHPAVRELHEARMSLSDFIVRSANIQTRFVGSVALENFSVIGLAEEFARSVALFNATFGSNLTLQSANVNPNRPNSGYEIEPGIVRLIDVHRAEDFALYRRAKELFERQVSKRAL